MKNTFLPKKKILAIALAAFVPPLSVIASAQTTEEETLVYGVRENRVSSGATGLPLEIKDTPQTISIISQEVMDDYNVSGGIDALELSTGINVDKYETNRSTFNARGFEVQLTQIDGLGLTNSYGTVVGQLDTFLFDKIELIRGANGLLTGVGNASGTVNYVRKRPTNTDEGKLLASLGSYDYKRLAADYNKVFTDSGSWAGRGVIAYEDKDSHVRDVHNENIAVYGVVDGQIGSKGVLTAGVTVTRNEQDSPMWGSLILFYPDGSSADFDRSASTSQDWTYWNTESNNAFIEYKHAISQNWDAKLTYNLVRTQAETRLLYAFSNTGALNDDNTGLIGWPYSDESDTDNDILDLNLSGTFSAFGQEHSLIAGISNAQQETETRVFSFDEATYLFQALPAFPYDGDTYAEPDWNTLALGSSGNQELTRFYAASHLSVTDKLKAIVGVNAIKLEREGSSIYGGIVDQTTYPDTEEVSPYLGVTYDLTDQLLAYVSYSDIVQNQDNVDINSQYLDPAKGVNMEVGVKSEWLNQKLLTTAAIFSAEQQGLATFAGITDGGQYYYGPQDINSEGIELEAIGKISDQANIAVGITHLELTDPNGDDIYEWVPRTTANLRADTSFASLPALRVGIHGRYQSDVVGSNAKQDAFMRFNMFAAYEFSEAVKLRLNVNNVLDEKYVEGLAYGAIYGAPRHAQLAMEYTF